MIKLTNGKTPQTGTCDSTPTASGEATTATLGLGVKTATVYRGVTDSAATGILRGGAVASGHEGKYLANSVEAAAEWAGARAAGYSE
jgi:hypothetical protein